jgi:hypothetical protein
MLDVLDGRAEGFAGQVRGWALTLTLALTLALALALARIPTPTLTLTLNLGQRGSLPAGLCSPVEALGGALEGQLRATPGVRLEVSVAPGAASARSKGD